MSRNSLFPESRLARWVLTQLAVWTPFVVAFLLGAPWWIAYFGVLPSVVLPAWTVAE